MLYYKMLKIGTTIPSKSYTPLCNRFDLFLSGSQTPQFTSSNYKVNYKVSDIGKPKNGETRIQNKVLPLGSRNNSYKISTIQTTLSI